MSQGQQPNTVLIMSDQHNAHFMGWHRHVNRIATIIILVASLGIFTVNNAWAEGKPLRIMPLGDSITAGYTDNPKWAHPFEFGYRSGLYRRLKKAGLDFVFVGDSQEPFDRKYGDPTHGGAVSPKLDLRALKQHGHRGYGGWRIDQIQKWELVGSTVCRLQRLHSRSPGAGLRGEGARDQHGQPARAFSDRSR